MILCSKIIWICFCLCFEIRTLGSSEYHKQDWWTTLKTKLLDIMSKSCRKGKKITSTSLWTIPYNLYYWLFCARNLTLLQALLPPAQLPLSCQVLTHISFLYSHPYQSKTERASCDSTCYLLLFSSPTPNSNSGPNSSKWHILGYMLLYSLWEKMG